jgi:hypothetical protein
MSAEKRSESLDWIAGKSRWFTDCASRQSEGEHPFPPRPCSSQDLEGLGVQPFTTCSWLSTENTPGTVFARIPATFLSIWLSTTPISVT